MSLDNPTFVAANDNDLLEYDARSIASCDSEITVDSEVAKRELEEFLLAREKPQDILDRIRELNAQALASGSGSEQINVYTINLNSLHGDSGKALSTIIEDAELVAPSGGNNQKAIENAPQQPQNDVDNAFMHSKSFKVCALLISSVLIAVTVFAIFHFLQKSSDVSVLAKGNAPAKLCYNFKDADRYSEQIVQRSKWLTRVNMFEWLDSMELLNVEKVIINYTKIGNASSCHLADLNENFILYGDSIFEVRGFKYGSGQLLDDFGTDFGGKTTLLITILAPSDAEDLKKKLKLLKSELIYGRSFMKNITFYDFDKIGQRETTDENWSDAFRHFKTEMQSIAIFPELPSITHLVDEMHFAHHYQVKERKTIQLIYMDLYMCKTRDECVKEIETLSNFYHFVFYENWIYQTRPLDCGYTVNNTMVENCDSFNFFVTKKYSGDIRKNLVKVLRMLMDFGKLKLDKYEYAKISAESKKFYGSEFYIEDLEDDIIEKSEEV